MVLVQDTRTAYSRLNQALHGNQLRTAAPSLLLALPLLGHLPTCCPMRTTIAEYKLV